MNKEVVRDVVLGSLMIAAAAIVSACSGSGNSTDAVGGPPAGASIDSFTVGSYPHQVYALNTSAATRAIVFLHGGGGTNFGMVYDLGLSTSNAPPTNDSVNWAWLESNQILAVFPQGQGLGGSGTATWSNWVMDSGQDDVGFLNTLATYIRSHYGVSKVYLVGHSNGGMMVNRMWCESPATFDAYLSLAGPASTHYLAGDPNFGAACTPSVYKPYYSMVGGQDIVLDTTDAGSGDSLFDADTWTINPSYVAASSPGSFLNPVLIGEWNQFNSIRSEQMCPGQPPPAFGAGTRSGDSAHQLITWSNCSGLLTLVEVVNANHWLSYHDSTTVAPDSLEGASGEQLTDVVSGALASMGAP